MHDSHLMQISDQAHGQSSCSRLGRLGDPSCLLEKSPPSIPTAAAPCALPSPGSHWHTGGAGGWHINAPSAVPSLTAGGTRTGIPGMWHRHPEQPNTGGRKVTPWGSQQSRASHAAHSSPARENCCCPVLQSNLFVFSYHL